MNIYKSENSYSLALNKQELTGGVKANVFAFQRSMNSKN